VVNFLAPVEVGELVSLMASVNYVGKTSMIIGIRVISENLKTHEVKHTNTSYFTMVAIGDNGRPKEVPGLILKSQDDIRRFSEAMHRKELKNTYKKELAMIKSVIDQDNFLQALKEERCEIMI
jgi:acyl-CoA hydrolase